MKYLDDSWERNEHFKFFQSRKNPCFSVSFSANVARLYEVKKQNGFRLTDCIYFAAMLAVHGVVGFRQRIVNLRPVEFERIETALQSLIVSFPYSAAISARRGPLPTRIHPFAPRAAMCKA